MADELISRQAAKEEILSWAVRITSPNNLSTADTMYVLDALPAVDAVPVVRCGECVSHGNCLTEDTFRIARIENPYCCGGKRREENAAD